MKYQIRQWVKHFENAGSKKLKRLDWVAIPIKMDGEGYAFLVDHPNGAAHFGAWIAIIEIAAKQDPRGTLPDGIGGISRSLSRISRLPSKLFDEVLPRLSELGWLELLESNQQPTATLGESANEVADDGIFPVAQDITGQDITEQEKPLSPTSVGSLFALEPAEKKYGTAWFDASFSRWYFPYWNKTGKQAARKAYEKRIKMLVHDGGTHEGAEGFLCAQLQDYRKRFEFTESWSWRVNMHPASWLNGQRWDDECLAADARASPLLTKSAEAAMRIADNLRAMNSEVR